MSFADSSGLYNNAAVVCPLCGTRRARRSCPALERQICAVCCGTKRLTEIHCPSDCPYLTSAREHPAAVVVRRQQHDVALLVQFMRDFSQRQTQLFFLVSSFLVRYEPPELQALIDDDVADATAALAATFETASRGVIYEHRPASLPADRLATTLKPILLEAGKGGGSAFERDAGVVLRRMEEAAREARAGNPSDRRALLDLLGRVIKKADAQDSGNDAGVASEEPRLIVP
jgi:hypothetical protein